MEVAPENDKESSHSARANGMNEWNSGSQKMPLQTGSEFLILNSLGKSQIYMQFQLQSTSESKKFQQQKICC